MPLEATAPLWLLAGFAASSSSPEGPLRMARDEQRLVRRELELDAERQALAEEQRRLRRRRLALDEREAELAGRAPAPAAIEPPPPMPPPQPESVVAQPAGWEVPKREEHWVEPPAPPDPEPEPLPVAPPAPEPVPMAASAPEPAFDPTGGLFYACRDIAVLRRLVAERGAEFPDRLDEWVIYLETLEPHAEDGILPMRFEQVVEDVFGPLLA